MFSSIHISKIRHESGESTAHPIDKSLLLALVRLSVNNELSHRKDDLESDFRNRYIPAARLCMFGNLLRMTI